MKLDENFLKKMYPAFMRTWENIGSDLEACCAEAGERLCQDGAIESVLDADRIQMYGNNEEAVKLLEEAFNEHGYDKVFKFFKKNIRLV